MKITPIENPLSGEHVIGVEPVLAPEIDTEQAGGWHRRLNLFTGRSLSDTALKTEQNGRAGRLALRGQAVSPGVVSGLEVQVGQTPEGVLFYHLSAGLGLAASGEDVVVPTDLRVGVRNVRVFAPSALLIAAAQAAGPGTDGKPLPAGFAPFSRDMGQPLGTFMDAAAEPDKELPHVGILVLQPIVAEMMGRPDAQDQCETDPANDAFEDWQLADGCRLLYYAWPSEMLALPDAGSTPEAAAQWRNQIAYTIFAAESLNGPDDALPWEVVGVPVALVAFDAAWNHLFLDRYTVVRTGGRPRRRSEPWNQWREEARKYFGGLIPQANNRSLWQARMQQLAEQVADAYLKALSVPSAQLASIGDIAKQFAFLPPAGLLPKEALQFLTTDQPSAFGTRVGTNAFFPTSYSIDAVVVPLEELDTALAASASLTPFDASAPDQVRILVPVPEALYEPDLLAVEQVSPEFQQAIDQYGTVRGRWLSRRQDVRDKNAALVKAITGQAPQMPDSDPEALDAEEPLAPEVDPNDPTFKDPEGDYGTAAAKGQLLVTAMGVLSDNLRQNSQLRNHSTVPLATVRDAVLKAMQKTMPDLISYDANAKTLTFFGLMSDEERDKLKSFGPDPAADQAYLTAIDQLYQASQNDELGQLDTLGLARFINFLQAKVNQADDHIDFSFLRMQTDIYRVRQLVLGNTAGTRLATSPALASIAQGTTAVATREAISTFYQALTDAKITKPGGGNRGPAADAPPDSTPPASPASLPDQPAADAPAAGGAGDADPSRTAGLSFSTTKDLSTEVPGSRLTLMAGTSIGQSLTARAARVDLSSFVSQVPGLNVIRPPQPTATSIDVIGQQPIIGAPIIRTATIAERLESPKAPEATKFTVSSKYDVVSSLKGLASNTGMFLDDIPVYGIARKPDGTYENDDFGQLKRRPKLLKDVTDDDILKDPDPRDNDEAAFFVASVELLDHTVATLRAVEGRIQAYRLAIAASQKTLSDLQNLVATSNARLQTIGDKLAESRHQLSFARALLAEEQVRVKGVNDRRDQILSEQVTFLAYHRPRANDPGLGTPTRTLDPGQIEATVPACLATSVTTPADLQGMVSLLRDAPVFWFTHVPRLLDFIDVLPALQNVLASAKQRAMVQFSPSLLNLAGIDLGITNSQSNGDASGGNGALAGAPSSIFRMAGTAANTPNSTMVNLGQAIERVRTTQQQAVAQVRFQTAQLDLGVVANLNWQRMRDQAASNLSLGDMIDGAHGRSHVSQAAAREMDDISRVATCVYTAASTLLPLIRLEWAELLSQYDVPVDLRNLANLPRWGQVDYLDRRNLQDLANWLYGRVDTQQPGALALMNDVLRVALMVASHAPVGQIVAGHVTRPATATTGSRLNVTVQDANKVSMGMQVVIYNQERVVARGLVEDLAGGEAVTRVTAVHMLDERGQVATSVALPAGARVQFTHLLQ